MYDRKDSNEDAGELQIIRSVNSSSPVLKQKFKGFKEKK